MKTNKHPDPLRAILLLLAAILLNGCSTTPKAELSLLQADCPNIVQVSRKPIREGVTAQVQIKRSPKTSAALDSARALKQLAAGTNFVTLAGREGKRLLEVSIERRWLTGSPRYYTLERLNLQNWTDVRNLTDEQLSELGSRKSSFMPATDYYVPPLLYLPVYSQPIHCPTPAHNYLPTYSQPIRCPISAHNRCK